MEYAKFVPIEEGLDISGLTQKVSDKIFDIGEVRKKKKQDLEDLTQEMIDESAIEMTDNNVINDKIAKFTEQYQNAIHERHKKLVTGQMSPAEYQRYMETAKRNIDAYAKSANSLDETIAKQAERIRKGEAGALQAEQIANLERIVSLENNQRVDENGRLVIDMSDGRVVAVDALTKPGMFISRRVDLQGDLDKAMAKWDANGVWNKFGIGGIEKWESLRDNDAYDLAKKRLALSMISGDGMQSVLLDHGGIEGAIHVYSKADAEKAIQEEIDKLSKLKEGKEITEEELEEIRNKVVLMDSKGKPVFTEEQEKKALELVQNAIDMRAAEKAKLNVQRPFDPRDKSTSTSRKAEIEQQSYNEGTKLAIQVMNAAPYETEVFEKLENYAKKNGQNIKIRKEKQADGTFKVLVDRVEYSKRFPRLEEWLKTAEGEKAVADSKKASNPDLELKSLYKEKISDDDSRKTISQTIVQSTKEIPTTKDLSEFIFPGLPGATRNLFELGVEGLASEGYTEDTHKRYKAYIYSLDRANKKHVTEEEWINLGMPSAYGETPTTTEEIPTYSKADLLSNGWTQENINEAVKQGKIKVN